MAVFISVFTYARKEGGLVGAFLSQNNKTKRLYCVLAVLIGLLITVLMLYGWVDNLAHLWWIPVCIVSAFVGALGVVALAQKRLGGFTGDVLGAAGIISETIGLIVAVGLAGAGKW
jgi:cobalamin synthase